MAQSLVRCRTYDEASTLLLGWYYSMRVDYLTLGELEAELTFRSVIVTADMDLSRKRKLLRDKLRAEGEGKIEKNVSILGSVDDNLKWCSKMVADMKQSIEQTEDEEARRSFRTRLLHYGARIIVLLTGSRGSPNLHGYMQNLLVEIVDIVEPEFHAPLQEPLIPFAPTDSINAAQQTEPANNEENVLDDDEEEQNEPNQGQRQDQPPPPLLNFSQGELECIHMLQNRIIGLEAELARRREGRAVAAQTDPVPPLPPYDPFSNPQSQDIFNNFLQNPFNSTFFNNSFNPNIQNPAPPLRNPVPPNPIPTQNNFPFNNPANPFPNNPHPHPNFNQNLPFPQTSLPQFSASHHSRHTLPVSKWNITKYSGDDQGLALNEFLELVQALSLAERVSDQELFESAVHLFTGSALKWYMTQRSMGRLMNWQHLMFELRRTYMHPDLDALIKMKVYQRRQQKNESFHEFYFAMEKLFRTMSVQIPDYEKLQILQQNMRVDYKRQMTFIPIVDLQTLVAAGQKLDALNFSAYNKVFGVEKTVQAVGNQDTTARSKQKGNTNQSQPPKRPPGPGKEDGPTQNQSRNNRNPTNYPQNQSQNPSSSKSQNPQSSPSQTNPQRNPVQNEQTPGPSGLSNRPTITLEQVVSGHKPPSPNTCFNCGTAGHHIAMCRQPRVLFCENCGLHGFPTNFCPYCLKNGPRVNENRRSQNTSA